MCLSYPGGSSVPKRRDLLVVPTIPCLRWYRSTVCCLMRKCCGRWGTTITLMWCQPLVKQRWTVAAMHLFVLIMCCSNRVAVLRWCWFQRVWVYLAFLNSVWFRWLKWLKELLVGKGHVTMRSCRLHTETVHNNTKWRSFTWFICPMNT